MDRMKKIAIALAAFIVGSFAGLSFANAIDAAPAPARAQQTQQPAASGAAKPIGTVKAISGQTITLTSDAGPMFSVTVQDSTRFLRIEPGAKDLKSAQAVHLEDLHEGDRILVWEIFPGDGHSVSASSVIVMKKADVEVKQQRDLQDWQRRGVGGLVSAVDSSLGTITSSTTSLSGTKTVTARVSKDTILRRYAPDSVKFDDATPSNIGQVKIGDQLRARGTRSADATEIAADEIVTGSFRNIAGTISSIDPASNTVSVADLATKKAVIVKVTAESQIRKLPPQMAQFMAVRLKGTQAGPRPGADQADAGGQQAGQSTPAPDAARPTGGRMPQVVAVAGPVEEAKAVGISSRC